MDNKKITLKQTVTDKDGNQQIKTISTYTDEAILASETSINEKISNLETNVENDASKISNLETNVENNTSKISANTAEIENLKASVNTGTFDPTSDNPASQKSTYNAIIPVTLEKLDQNLQETIRIHGVHIDNNRADINANTDEIEKMQDSLNTGTFDPTSNDPASQKSIAGAMASKDVAENKNVLIRLECREDGLYVVGTDI